MSAPDRRKRLDRTHSKLSIRRQCLLLSVARAAVYRPERVASDSDLALMRRIDELYLQYPFLGSRRIAEMLSTPDERINRKRVQRLMRIMGIVALGPKPNTSKPGKGHKIFPYLLRDLPIVRPNHVWCADITYIPMGRGFFYLVAIMDWYSRAVLAWRLSNSLDTSFCMEALARFGKPEIFNTDQGSQFTSSDFTGRLEQAKIRISMALRQAQGERSRGRWMDNVFIERLWRSLKYEDIYLKGYTNGVEARAGIGAWINFYNHTRPHSALGHKTPIAIWRQGTAAGHSENAVDIMDNARALPTYPQHQQPAA
jgi:putative transposase